MGKVINLPQNKCEECGIREATILCDYDVGYVKALYGTEVYIRVTCDKRLCKKCSHKINHKDYCTGCFEKIKEQIESE